MPFDALNIAGERAVKEARALEQAGFDGLIVENFGDAPFYGSTVPPETIASMAVIMAALKDTVSIPLGVNVLRNDAQAALAIASILDCRWIRVNVLCGVAATDQGMVEGRAAFLLRERARLGAESVELLADVHVKHAQTLSSVSRVAALEDTVIRGHANGVVVTGEGTGKGIDPAELPPLFKKSRELGVPFYIGSGVRVESWPGLKKHCDGVIVSSALRELGLAGKPLDSKRVKSLIKILRA